MFEIWPEATRPRTEFGAWKFCSAEGGQDTTPLLHVKFSNTINSGNSLELD